MTRSLLLDVLSDFFPTSYSRTSWTDNYPPTDVVKLDSNNLVIDMALAGMSRDDITVTRFHDRLEIEAKPKSRHSDDLYLRRGISQRSFKNVLGLTSEWTVKEVKFTDGLLSINLQRELPEELKPKLLEIR